MAIDNLNYYSAWLPAWQQTDKYSSQPWCLKSKNLDIFSSSKSVKSTAWSTPVAWNSWVIASEWWLELRADWKVYENWVVLVDPSEDIPVYPVCYTWKNWTYVNAQWGTSQAMSVASEWNERKSFVVFSDRASYVYSKTPYIVPKQAKMYHLIYKWVTDENWYEFHKTPWYYWRGMLLTFTIWDAHLTEPRILKIRATDDGMGRTWKQELTISNLPTKFNYDKQQDAIVVADTEYSENLIPEWWSVFDSEWITVEVPAVPWEHTIQFGLIDNTQWPDQFEYDGKIYVDCNGLQITNATSEYDVQDDAEEQLNHLMTGSTWDYNWYYSYLPIRDREIVPVWEYYWIKGQWFQVLYEWASSWASIWWEQYVRYDFVQYMWWPNDPWMDVIWMIVWNEQVYMIGNKNWNGYITLCDLSWGRWTPYIAYGCIFKWVTNIDYLMYLVWEDRGIANLWVFNQQELVPIIWWNKEVQLVDLVWVDEQYKFDWRLINWRKNLILTTSDNRIFQYGQTYGGKWGVFIHQLPKNADITGVSISWNDLVVRYNVTVGQTTTQYTTTYQDDTPYKNYNTEWSATYPIVIGNHLLEKEESDLFTSFILPSADCSLEFRWMANHYHFWTFTSADTYTFDPAADYKMKWCTGDYVLKFIEKNDNQYTFRLEGDLPVQSTSDMKITNAQWTELITYSEYNHFRKIWEITTDKYLEWEFRFHNLNNKLELPKSHSLQIMVNGKWTQTHTPELFALDLVANQRDRW